MNAPSASRRIAGVTVPLFSLYTERSWGLGEIGDLVEFTRWATRSGVRLVQLLPLGEIAGGETSPYSALSAFGIDPLYISLADVEDLPRDTWHDALKDDGVRTLDWVRAQSRIPYDAIRWLKERALHAAFDRFRANVQGHGSARAESFERFTREHAGWLEDYALFRALKDAHARIAWWDWPALLRDRDPASLARARDEYQSSVLRYQYLQWLAHTQWANAREALREMGVEIMGDLPFMVGRDSADVWANQGEFRNHESVGVPGDQFSEDGQEWGLPPYNWSVMRENAFAWLRRRARYSGVLYDRFRIDHLVGFYRTYMRPVDKLRSPEGKLLPGFFDPADEPAQQAHGEAVIGAMIAGAAETGAQLVAEDLGVIPNFVRPSLTAMGVPGYKVLIWEKDDNVFRDPAKYPALSVACFGTHDTDPVAVWWETREAYEREAVCRLPVMAAHGGTEKLGGAFTPEVHAALCDLILQSGSELVLLLAQDILGTRDRINTPGTVGEHNWTWRFAKPVSAMAGDAGAEASIARVRAAIEKSGRSK